MIDALKNFIEERFAPKQQNQSVEEKINLAAAALLIEVAYSDNNIAEVEQGALKNLLVQQFDIPNRLIDELVAHAESEVREASSAYEFTRAINAYFETEEKYALVQAMWQIAYADGNLDRYEESMIRKLADLLYVSHSDFIRAKLSIQEQQ